MIKFLRNKLFNKENIKYIVIVLVIVLGLVTVYCAISINEKNKGIIVNKFNMLEEIEDNKIGVYIDGEVKNPGYIKIKKRATLEYAINIVGGITKDADIQNIDLKRSLKNQEKIIIPAIKEEFTDEELDSENNIDRININTATKEELMGLEGIGEKTADNIIMYRLNKSFDSIEEIMKVKGIGEGKFDKIEENICI